MEDVTLSENKPALVSDIGDDSSSEEKRSRKNPAKMEGALKCKYCDKRYFNTKFYDKHIQAHGKFQLTYHKTMNRITGILVYF